MSLVRALATVGGLTLGSRVLGFLRDLFTAALLGAGPLSDAFVVAQRLPNLFRSLFAEGAFNTAFVPIFTGLLAARGRDPAVAFAERALAWLVLALLPLTALAIFAMPLLIAAMAPGFLDDPSDGRYAAAVTLGQITFPYLLLISVTMLQGALLNGLERFGPAASAPIVFNLGMIASLGVALALGLDEGGVAAALSYGMVASGLAQLLWLAWAVRRAGIRLHLPMPRLTPEIRRLGKIMAPAALGTSVVQLNVFVSTLLASFVENGPTYIYYADRINQLPLGVIGVAVGTALLPMLTRALRSGEAEAGRRLSSQALEAGLALSVPAAVAALAIAFPILATLFERGRFTLEDAAATAPVLAAYALGIPAFVATRILATQFFAREDTATPTKAGVLAAGINIALGVALVWPLGAPGLALATTLGSLAQGAVLLVWLRRRGLLQLDPRTPGRLLRLALAASLMGAGLYAGAWALGDVWAGPELPRFLALAGLVLGGLAIYLVAGQLLRAFDVRQIRAALRRPPRGGGAGGPGAAERATPGTGTEA